MVFGLFKAKQMECAPYQHEHAHPEPPPLIKFLLDLGIPEFVETGVRTARTALAPTGYCHTRAHITRRRLH